ncbi:acyl-CoA dehydrogenase family protein [Desulfosudis oleivorans]|uniref:Acyl-CoA dehydrogenase domain protein n=1 Tax=Desulfosudis oleivorans (strain DSM 6200 / JCM 39069 / Hxd3) TaxID=96561 RepID=A8ZRT4_DESOH|nr:acyl-CoA dehydrogenase family protein [Desulfosudis oleivorans]ABW65851.1 acyl-CoA dehydrogenase domain protein [Desulfosudis oleivorans Hxd3]
MISRGEKVFRLGQRPAFDDMLIGLSAAPKIPAGLVRETREVVALARKFNDEVVRPYTAELDLKMHADPNFIPYEFVSKANEWGFYTMWIPRIFGGRGYNMPSMSVFVEEIGSACLAMANLIGVHYLGVATLCAAWNAAMINRLCRDVAAGEKNGVPCLISLAITEPGAGTDVEEVDLVDRANLSCLARRVEGGYMVNGTKIFISNGHISTWHMLITYTDLEKPSENTVMLAVKTGDKGFSFGRMEHKLGQKGCPASELVFKDCFIPDDRVCFGWDLAGPRPRRDRRAATMQVIDFVVSATRAGVGAFATGGARGAFETALAFAAETEVNGSLLINHEWAQCMLAEMYKNVVVSRLTYVEANHANGRYGFYRLMQQKIMFYYLKYVPAFIVEKIISPLLETPGATWLLRKVMADGQTDEELERCSGMASLSKFAASDAGIRNCHLALEMMGQAGLRHDRRAEKILRDAKLLQIYEGTNQLNRLNLFKNLIGRDYPQATVFDE